MKIIDGKPEYRGAVVRFNLQVIFTMVIMVTSCFAWYISQPM